MSLLFGQYTKKQIRFVLAGGVTGDGQGGEIETG